MDRGTARTAIIQMVQTSWGPPSNLRIHVSFRGSNEVMEIPKTRKPSISLIAGDEEIASCASQSVVPAPTSSAFPGDLREMQILRLTLDLLNQKFWR